MRSFSRPLQIESESRRRSKFLIGEQLEDDNVVHDLTSRNTGKMTPAKVRLAAAAMGSEIRGSSSVSPPDVQPFLKWAGGKRWLTERFPEMFPAQFNRYFEPFLGSGSVFFFLNPVRSYLSDGNPQLVDCFSAIKADWRAVVRYLRAHARRHSDAHYYQARAARPTSGAARAARLIYLNRSCWNGLYRVNLRGEFNVPRGTKNSILLDADNFEAVAHRLAASEVVAVDFEAAIRLSRRDDFIFVDPPYTVSHNNNGFLKYNETIFSWSDQIRLRDSLVLANRRGAKFLLTNANHPSVVKLYQDIFAVDVVERQSVISGAAHGRVRTSELIVRNYQPPASR